MIDDQGRSVPPWTPEEVASLNGYQWSGVFHPFTCGNAECRAILVATESGWTCPDCEYRQAWAHQIMANGAWRETVREFTGS
jgi:hypothetical protein